MPIPLGVLAVAGAGPAAIVSDFEWLETTRLTSTTASVSFSNLNNYSAYKHLQLRLTMRGDEAGTGQDNLRIRLNNDSASNYTVSWLRGTGSSAQSSSSTTQTSMTPAVGIVPRKDNTAGIFGVAVVDLLEFSNTNKKKTLKFYCGAEPGQIGLASGFWNSTSAITTITLSEGSTRGFVSGCVFSLYGIKG